MSAYAESSVTADTAAFIRVRGIVQGVGFRPHAWRLAHRHGLRGWVANDGEGVSIHACGAEAAIEDFVRALANEAPPLARIDAIDRVATDPIGTDSEFRIVASGAGASRTGVAADTASCAACVAEVFDPISRRYRYPFTNCTHCGPRLSIIEAIPYDRSATTMRAFALPAVQRRIPRPARPALSRPADRLPRLRAPRLARTR